MRRTALLLTATMVALLMASGVALAVVNTSTDGSDGPKVIKTVATDGKVGFDRDANIRAIFSEAMRAKSINGSTFELYRGNYTYQRVNCTADFCVPSPIPVGSKVSYKRDRKLAVLDPSRPLRANTTYTAVVEGANDRDGLAVKCKAHTEMATDHIWVFTTGDN